MGRKVKNPLFSQVALAEDLPEYHLKRGDIAVIVEHYPMAEGQEDGYSLEGFDVPNVTIEVAASQIMPVSQWQHEEAILLNYASYLRLDCFNLRTI